jgi:SAM-dependent methyltransferase
MQQEYSDKPGYVPEADLGLGCGLPVDTADIQPGHTVLDLGSGAGNDAFVAREIVGPEGRVIGVDMTADMIRKARENVQRLGYTNVEFRLGELESLPIESGTIDRAVSNCVFNLVPDKAKAYSELARVLKPEGRFSISDIVLEGTLPTKLLKVAELYAGCVSGAQDKDEAKNALVAAGLKEVTAAREREFKLPDDFLALWLDAQEIQKYRESGCRLLSVTWTGTRV